MPLSDSISNIIGTKIPYWLWQQFQTRSKKGSSETRDLETIKYLANKTAWVRLVSSINIKDEDLDYFSKMNPEITKGDDLAKQYVLFGGTSKYLSNNSYGLRSGFSGLGSNPSYGGAYGIMGENKLSNEVAKYGYRPMPGITNVNIETQGRLGSVRSATVNFKCWDKDQLDVIDALYFKLGFSMFLEWGHTYYFPSQNPKGDGQPFDPSKAMSTELVSIDPFDNRYNNNKELIFRQITKNNRETEGNYDAMLGIVTNFNFSMNQEGGYDCMIKIISLGVLGDSIKVNNSSKLIEILGEQIKEYSSTLERLRAPAQPTDTKEKNKIEPKILEKLLNQGNGDTGQANINSFPGSNSLAANNTTVQSNTYGSLLYVKKQNRFIPENTDKYQTKIKLSRDKIGEILNKVKDKLKNKNDWKTEFTTLYYKGEKPIKFINVNYPSSVNQYINSTDRVLNKEGYDISFSRPFQINTNVNEVIINGKRGDIAISNLLAEKNLATLESQQGLDEGGFFSSSNKSRYLLNYLPKTDEREGYTFSDTESQIIYDKIADHIASNTISDIFLSIRSINKEAIENSAPLLYKYSFTVEFLSPITLNSKIVVTNVTSKTGKKLETVTFFEPEAGNLVEVSNNAVTFNNVDVTYYVPTTITFQESDFIQEFITPNVIEALQPAPLKNQNAQTQAFPEEDSVNNPFSYLSNIELMLRSIQVHSLVYALKSKAVYGRGQGEDSEIYLRSVVKVPLYENKGTSKPFSEQLFSNGVFQDDVIRDLTNGNVSDSLLTDNPENANTKNLFKVYAKYGFATKLMADLAPVDKFKEVNYQDLLTTYVFPYNVTQQLESGTPMNHPVYIQFGLFLMMLNHSCTLYNPQSQFPTPIVYIDYNPNHSLCLTTPVQLSTDPFTAMIPFEGSLDQYKKLFDKDVLEGETQIKPVSGSNFTTLFQPRNSPSQEDRDRISGAIPSFIDNDSLGKSLNRGRIMNILLNMDYLSDVIKQFAKKDGENKVFLKPLIEQILTDVNKSIGNFNIFRLSYNDAGNTFQIVDDQIVPVSDQNEQQIFAVRQPGDDPTEIPIYGKGSVAKNLEIKTDVSTRLSNMLAISANSKGKQGSNSTDASSFGFINYNYTDRYISERGELDTTGSVSVNLSGEISSATQFNSAVKYFYCTDTLDAQRVSTATNYYIAKLSNFKADDAPTRSSAMIPVSLNFTTDGISGLYMGQAFTINREFLPYTYSIKKMFNNEPADNKVGFVITGLNHTIEGNVWNTAVKTNMIFLKRKSDYPTGSLSDRVIENIQTSIEDVSKPGEYAVYNTNTGVITGYQKGDTIGKVYGSKQRLQDKIALEKVQEVFRSMLEAAKKDGVNFTINSGYRNFNEQYALRKQNVIDKNKENDDQYLRTADSKKFNPYTSRPGFSQHQNGIAFDIATLLDGGKSFEWLSKNAEKYGFVRTVGTERWHWEYRPDSKKYDFIPSTHYSWTFGAEPPNKQNA